MISEKRLKEIEAREDAGCDGHAKMSGAALYCPCLDAHSADVREFIAEVRRLRGIIDALKTSLGEMADLLGDV